MKQAQNGEAAQEESLFDQIDTDEQQTPEQKRHMVSQEDRHDGPQASESSDSLENSFRETELASDDEVAEQQVVEKRRLLSHKKPNKEALSMLQHSHDDH